MSIWYKYFETLDDNKENIIINILTIAKKFSANSIEEMPYGVPGLKLKGKPLIAVATHKEHYGIYPFSSNVIKEAKAVIGNNETAKGTIRFKYDTFPSEELIKLLIELRSKEINKSRISSGKN